MVFLFTTGRIVRLAKNNLSHMRIDFECYFSFPSFSRPPQKMCCWTRNLSRVFNILQGRLLRVMMMTTMMMVVIGWLMMLFGQVCPFQATFVRKRMTTWCVAMYKNKSAPHSAFGYQTKTEVRDPPPKKKIVIISKTFVACFAVEV